jgi:hypothetical protein
VTPEHDWQAILRHLHAQGFRIVTADRATGRIVIAVTDTR